MNAATPTHYFLALRRAGAVGAVALAVVLPACGGDDEPGGGGASGSNGAEQGDRDIRAATEVGGEASVSVRIRDGQPVGGPKELSAQKGDRVSITVSSDAPGRIHLHGYEIFKSVAPTRKAVFDFEAEIEGLFDMEVEGPGTEVLELEVRP